MDAQIAQRLIELNRGFYQTLAEPFSATRGRVQPGVRTVLLEIPAAASLLDLGCGNGNLAAELAERGHSGGYLGLDFSEDLLRDARERLSKYDSKEFTFKTAELTGDWSDQVKGKTFDVVLAFAVLHHIPSRDLRLNLLKQVRECLAPDGRFIHSTWQFMNSPRLRERLQPWSAARLADTEVDQGDYLLDWRSGSTGLRYAHQFSEAELAELAAASGFQVVETFLSDGESGNLGLYSIWSFN